MGNMGLTQRIAIGMLLLFVSAAAERFECGNSELQCPHNNICASFTEICDGSEQCPNGEDEDRNFCGSWSSGSCPSGYYNCETSGSYNHYSNYECQSYKDVCQGHTCSNCPSSTICYAILQGVLPSTIRTKKNAGIELEQLEGFLEIVNKSLAEGNSTAGCPMFYVRVGDQCLSLLPFKLSWPEAKLMCNAISGNLLQVGELNLHRQVAEFFITEGINANFWAGGFFDIVYDDWRWINEAKMPLGTPFWTMTHSDTCKKRMISEEMGFSDACYYYHQAPTVNQPGQCTSLDYENMYFFSNSNCTLLKRPLCVYS